MERNLIKIKKIWFKSKKSDFWIFILKNHDLYQPWNRVARPPVFYGSSHLSALVSQQNLSRETNSPLIWAHEKLVFK